MYILLDLHKSFLVLERKISVRKSRQELIDKGVLKDIPENGR